MVVCYVLRKSPRFLVVLGLCLSGAICQAQESSESLDRLLQDVRQQALDSAAASQEREQLFGEAREQSGAILERTTAELQRETERSTRLRAQFDSNELLLEELNDALRIRTGDLGELFGVFRQMAADSSSVINGSLVSIEFPGRRRRAAEIARSGEVPGIAELRELQLLLLEEMVESGKISRFETPISDASGLQKTARVVRLGTFNILSAEGYLQAGDDGAGLNELPRQPARRYSNSAREFVAATSGNAAVAIDPSRGALLSLVIQSPGLLRQVAYGGLIGYVILVIGAFGLGISLWRFVFLRGTASRVARQLHSDTFADDNPLGRVLAVASANSEIKVEALERKLDEAVLRETPMLERYQGIIKVMAGVAPLLGLLGTVVGMIRTFQTITLFGTGDPKMMADGISQALVTTVEGLVVAIPLVFLHALITDKSRELIDILEEQSAGIIARYTERSG